MSEKLTFDLLVKAMRTMEKLQRKKKPCFSCGKPTTAYKSLAFVAKKGLGPICGACKDSSSFFRSDEKSAWMQAIRERGIL